MDTKSKLIVTLASVTIVAVVAIVSLVVVLAAFSTQVSNQFSVSYTVRDVVCNVTAEHRTATKGETSITGDYTTIGTASFDGTETGQNNSKELTALSGITIVKNQYFVIRYTIDNTLDGSLDMTLDLDTSSTITTENCTIKYAHSTTDISTNLDVNEASFSTEFTETTIAKNTTSYLFILIQVTSFALDASFSGNIKWVLSSI